MHNAKIELSISVTQSSGLLIPVNRKGVALSRSLPKVVHGSKFESGLLRTKLCCVLEAKKCLPVVLLHLLTLKVHHAKIGLHLGVTDIPIGLLIGFIEHASYHWVDLLYHLYFSCKYFGEACHVFF
ncbi:hypothetical protein D3C86_1856110 [compost metagenome]